MGMDHLDATRVDADPDTKPEIVLKPSELAEYHRNKGEWLGRQQEELIARCRAAAWNAIEPRIPEQLVGHDGWETLDQLGRDRLCAAIMATLVTASGSTELFVTKLLPKPIKQYVLEAVRVRRKALASRKHAETSAEAAAE